MKKLFMINVFVAIGMFSFGQTGNIVNRPLNQDTEGTLLKKSSNIKYIDISIQQPGVEECLGVSVPRLEFDNEWLNIYPNPNPGKFTLELQLQHAGTTLLIQLYDTAGKLMFEISEIPNEGKFRKDLDVSHLKKGVYFLYVTGKDKVGVKQIIIN